MEQSARIVLKALYVARISRPDIYFAVNTLAREVTRWTVACDRRLHRLISYMHWTQSWVQLCWVGDKPEDIIVALYVDAGFGGDLADSKSSTGAMLCLMGPNTFVPLTWLCKKNTAVSHSSSEAEVIAMDAGVRLEGLPALAFWEEVLTVVNGCTLQRGSKLCPAMAQVNSSDADFGHTTEYYRIIEVLQAVDYIPLPLPPSSGLAQLLVLEDNEAVIKMCNKGRSAQMRHVCRTQRIDID